MMLIILFIVKISSICNANSYYSAQENDKYFVLARYNTYQFSQFFTYSTTRLWNSLPNEAVLAVKQDRFIVLAKKFMWSIIIINTYIGCVLFSSSSVFFYFFSLNFVMLLCYSRYWEALYEEGNKDEGILILRPIFLLFYHYYFYLYNFTKLFLL